MYQLGDCQHNGFYMFFATKRYHDSLIGIEFVNDDLNHVGLVAIFDDGSWQRVEHISVKRQLMWGEHGFNEIFDYCIEFDVGIHEQVPVSISHERSQKCVVHHEVESICFGTYTLRQSRSDLIE